MNFVDWWKKSSAQAGEDYYKLRFDEAEINDFRGGLLNPAARAKFDLRVKKYAKMSGALLGGCLGLMSLLAVPFVCLFGYGFYTHPSIGIGIFWAIFIGLIIAVYTFVGWKLYSLSKDIKSDLKNGRVNSEAGRLTIKVETRNESLHVTYSINRVEFKVLEDVIGAEIHRQFLSSIINLGDSRTTVESYRFYYLPQSKLILHYEPA